MNTYRDQSAENQWETAAFCSQCGARMSADDQFCKNCGAKLSDGPSTMGPEARRKHRKVWLPVAVILLFFAIVALSQGFGGQSVVRDVKSVAFGQDASFGTMIENTCDHIKWTQEKLYDNVYQVEVSGTMQAIKYHSELEGTPLYFTLVATYHGDTVYAELQDGSCADATGQNAYARLVLYYKLQTGEVGYVNGNIAFSDVADQFDDPTEYEAIEAVKNVRNSVNDTRENICWRLFECSYRDCSGYEQYAIEGYFNLNLVQMDYRDFVAAYPEYGEIYYYTNVIDQNSDEYQDWVTLQKMFGVDIPFVDQETDIREKEEISEEPLADQQPVTEIVAWQTVVGEWDDQNGLGYTMLVSENEAETDMVFSISFAPHGSASLEWVLPCKLATDDGVLCYDKGVMTYMEIVPDENGNPSSDSSVEKGLIGSFSFDSYQDILCWYNDPKGASNPIIFVRSRHAENKPAEITINGIPHAVADADGWGDTWQTIAEIIGNGTDIYFKEAEDDPTLYGTGNAWDDITIEGITYEMADKHGWGDIWWEAAAHFGSDYDAYSGAETYDDSFVQGNDSDGELSNAELIKINDPISIRLAGEWKNAYNQSVPRDSKISNVHARTAIPTIKRSGIIATVITEVEFWFVRQGGSPVGSVYTVVIIDTNNGDVLSANITS